jgi:hypothetical protein
VKATEVAQVSNLLYRRASSLQGLLLLLISFTTPAAEDQPPRAARSVHLSYPAPEGELFYNEVTVEQSVPGSYFMACGWDKGYFGIQQLSGSEEKVVLFSLWDPSKGDNPNSVKTEDRVEVVEQGEGVRIRRFGGEGTGAQCMAPFDWKIGETNRFLIQCKLDEDKASYTAFLWSAQKQSWWKLATFRTRSDGHALRGYYSFVEDFRRDGKSPNEMRRAAFGNGWVRTAQGNWEALNGARFTASNATWESRDNIDAGIANGRFYLATGGEIKTQTKLHDLIQLPSSAGKPPSPDHLPQPAVR